MRKIRIKQKNCTIACLSACGYGSIDCFSSGMRSSALHRMVASRKLAGIHGVQECMGVTNLIIALQIPCVRIGARLAEAHNIKQNNIHCQTIYGNQPPPFTQSPRLPGPFITYCAVYDQRRLLFLAMQRNRVCLHQHRRRWKNRYALFAIQVRVNRRLPRQRHHEPAKVHS